MHVSKVVAFLFIGIVTSFGQRDFTFLPDGYKIPVPASVMSSHLSSALLSSRINLKRIKRGPRLATRHELFSLSFHNNLANDTYAYVVGKDINGRVIMLQPDGTFYRPEANGAAAPVKITQDIKLPLGALGSTLSIDLPAHISSARIYIARGELQFHFSRDNSLIEPSPFDPADPSALVRWGFVEFTYNASGVWANISAVDFVGLPVSISLTSRTEAVQSTTGLSANSITYICNDLYIQSKKDGQPWDKLCQMSNNGTPLRVLAPTKYIDANPKAFNTYWTDYINQVWLSYASRLLIIDTQTSIGRVQCQVLGDVLQCIGDNRNYAKPTAFDIFGCNTGPFEISALDNNIHRAVVPRLCAAFNRSTLLLNGGNIQPSLSSSSYYSVSPTNHFSRIVHKYEVDGNGYAFSYDDVNPTGEDHSGTVSTGNPLLLAIRVGGV